MNTKQAQHAATLHQYATNGITLNENDRDVCQYIIAQYADVLGDAVYSCNLGQLARLIGNPHA